MKGQIRVSTAVLLCVIAVLVGALVVTFGTQRAPFVPSAQAATYEQGPLVTFAPVLKRAMPAVVNISSSKVVKNRANSDTPGMFDDPFFRQFFGGRMPQGRQQQPRERRAQSLGSGVIVSPDGYILTNNHVVEGASEIKVSFSDKREFPAKLIGTDPMTDVAVIKIAENHLPTVPLSDSSHAQVGDVVLAIGDPFGLGQTATMGIVSATGRSGLGIERFENFIQTDAPINPGNSGGALIDTHGDLIGINTAILAGDSGGNQGIGFAIPINMAKAVMDQILKTGKAQHGFIGITLDPNTLTPEKARAFGMGANAHGVPITDVSPNSPASKAGLQAGDVITSLNGKPVDDMQAFRGEVAAMMPGQVANLGIFRNGREMQVPVTLGNASNSPVGGDNDQDNDNALPGNGEKGALPGVSVQGLNSDMRQQLRLPQDVQGVVITDLDPESAAAQAGLEQGDIIVQVNHKKVTSVQQFNTAVQQGDGSGSTLLLVRRGEGSEFVVVPNKK
jgi:serine protease Do